MSHTPAPQTKQQAYDRLQKLVLSSSTLIEKRLPQIIPIDRMITDVLTSFKRTPRLLVCDPHTVLGTVLQAAEIGLRLNGFLGEAYMVPFWNKHSNRLEAQFQAGYRGLITLARRSGEVTKIEPRLVFDFDTQFTLRYGTDPYIHHEPNVDHPDYMRRDAGGDLIGLRGAYAVCTYKDGHDFEYCNIVRLGELRARSQARDKEDNEVGPWTTDPAEMYRKVPIRQLAKRLPLSSDEGRFQRAAALDEYGDAGIAQDNGAIIEADHECRSIVADVVRDQVEDLRAKHVRPDTQPPQIKPWTRPKSASLPRAQSAPLPRPQR